MQQRVCIARALICEPDVLLMDEPFSAVDAMTRAILQELILKIWETIPVTILFVTHDVDEAVFLSSRVMSLSRAPATIREDLRDRSAVSARSDQNAATTNASPRSGSGCSPASSCRKRAAPAAGRREPRAMKKRWPGFVLLIADPARVGIRLRVQSGRSGLRPARQRHRRVLDRERAKRAVAGRAGAEPRPDLRGLRASRSSSRCRSAC